MREQVNFLNGFRHGDKIIKKLKVVVRNKKIMKKTKGGRTYGKRTKNERMFGEVLLFTRV